MQSDRFDRLRQLFESALRLERAARTKFIEQSCRNDPELRRELESLLAAAEATISNSDLFAGGRIDLQKAEVEKLLDRASSATITHDPSRAPRPAPPTPSLPERIGQYRIVRAIASGGMGTVYEAEQQSPKRTVALKVIRHGLTSPALLRRFELESQVLGRLQHPGIAQIYEAGFAETESGTQPFFAMEYVRGEDLRKYVTRTNLGTRQRLDLIARICDAVHHAHQKGVIHRDLKPGNILVDASGQPKILDFGVARATDSDMQVTTMQTDVGQLIGTIQYMSPEQVSADPNQLDTRSDVYSLGVIAFEILTGRPPYDLKNKMIHEAARIIREEELTRLSTFNRTLRGEIETIVGKALEKEKDRRYPSAAGLAEDIRRYLADEPILARPPSANYQLQKFAKRNKALATGMAVAAAALLVGMITSTSLYVRAENARRGEAQQRRLAETRAADLKAVSEFQQSMLSGINSEEMGKAIVKSMRDGIRERMEERGVEPKEVSASLASFDALSRYVNATNLALRTIDDQILKRAADTIVEEFADRTQVRTALLQAAATTYREIGLLNSALPLQETVLDHRKRELGDAHPDTLTSMNETGLLLERLGRAPEAEPYLRGAFEARRRILGEDHPDTLQSMGDLSSVLYWLGESEESLLLHQEVLEARRRVLGEHHTGTLVAMSNLSILLQDLKQFDDAEDLRRKVYEGQRRLLGEDHPHTLIALFNLGYVYQAKGNLEEALRYYRQTLDADQRVLGDDHPLTLQCMNAVAMALDRLGRTEEALPYFRKAMDRRRLTLGDVHRDTLTSVNNMGHYLNKLGRFDESANLLEEYEPAAREVCSYDVTHMLGSYLSKLGEAQAGQGRWAAAENTLLDAVARNATSFGEADGRTGKSMAQLVKLYDAWHAAEPDKGYDAKAAQWRAKLDEPSKDAATTKTDGP